MNGDFSSIEPGTAARGPAGANGTNGTDGTDGAPGPAGPAPTGSGRKVLATPADGSSGEAALRNLVMADLPIKYFVVIQGSTAVGSGVPVAFAHGLGATPQLFWATFENPSNLNTLTHSLTADATNLNFAWAGDYTGKVNLFAIRFG